MQLAPWRSTPVHVGDRVTIAMTHGSAFAEYSLAPVTVVYSRCLNG